MLEKIYSTSGDPVRFLPYDNLGHCLDVGCGNGRISENIYERCDELVSIEVDPQRLREAATKHLGSFCLADGCHLPFEDNTFDTVISYTVIEHIPESNNYQFLSEIKRVLKNQGIAYLVNDSLMYRILRKSRLLYPTRGPDPTHVNMVRPRTLVHRLQQVGFEIEMWHSTPVSHFVENERLARFLSDFGTKGHVVVKKSE
ncbi:class I SAM-dependent methyltransferase [Halorubrum sp. CGM5_25_10-8B]|uniref:class I SAM-dependent methyltransferase n=1 Tax=Halorubrum sp. CGM5_25_10-8B TaxID=2518115 RepID=UPI00130E561C|nr:class I SAM-dependent methyltransferase [Halorubrum sp. CGM5_25_10-8B]